jgi:hypothetical protein
MHPRARQRRRLAWPLIAALAVLPAAATAPPASAAGTFHYAVAFQAASNRHLWYYDGFTGVAHDTGLAMAYGSTATSMTSPAMVFDDSGLYVIAFQAKTAAGAGPGRLFLYWPQGNGHLDTGLTMLPGTSPSIAQTDTVAFQANTGRLWYYDGVKGHATNLVMAAGTSPSISPDGAEIAFQASTGHLWYYNVGGQAHDSGLVMHGGTSPSVGMCGAQCYDVAYQSSTGHLVIYRLGSTHVDTGLSMFDNPGMDPTNQEFVAYAGLPSGHVFWHDTVNNTTTDTGYQIQNGSSPSMGPLSDPTTGLVTDWMIAFTPVVSGGTLYTYDTTNKISHNTGLAVEPFTSPAFTTGERLVFG